MSPAPTRHYQFNRTQTCLIAGISVEAYKTLRRRRQVEIGWTLNGEYSDEIMQEALDVAAWAAIAALMGVSGDTDPVSPATANRIVKSNLGAISQVLEDTSVDRYIGVADDEIVSGTSQAIFEYLSPEIFGEGFSPTRLYLLNITKVIKDLRLRAEQEKIPFPSEHELREIRSYYLDGQK